MRRTNNCASPWKARNQARAQHMQTTRHRGTLLRLERKSSEALPWIEQSIAASAKGRFQRGDHAMSLVELGLTRLELGDFAAARQSFVQAASILDELQPQRMTPTRADLMIGMARVHLQASEPAEALRGCRRPTRTGRAKARQPLGGRSGAVAGAHPPGIGTTCRGACGTGPRLQATLLIKHSRGRGADETCSVTRMLPHQGLAQQSEMLAPLAAITRGRPREACKRSNRGANAVPTRMMEALVAHRSTPEEEVRSRPGYS